jgi:hypothetical protein
MFLFVVQSVGYILKKFLNLAQMFIVDKRPQICQLKLCYGMICYVTACTTSLQIINNKRNDTFLE